MLFVSSCSQTTDRTDDVNSALFASVGRTAVSTGFAHLVIDLDLEDLKKNFEYLRGTITAVVEGNSKIDASWHEALLFGLNSDEDKLTMLWDLAHQNLDSNGILELKDDKEFADLIQSTFSTTSAATPQATPATRVRATQRTTTSPASSTPTTPTVTPDPDPSREPLLRKRRSPSLWPGVLTATGLAAFGTSLYTRGQLSQIAQAAEANAQNNLVVAEQAEDNALRIREIYSFLEKQKQAMVKEMNKFRARQKNEVMKVLYSYFMMIETRFRLELRDYFEGIAALMNGRLSPKFIEPSKLKETYDSLLLKARASNLQPLSEDPGIIFQSTVTTIATSTNKLKAIVHVPMYSGSMMTIYRYIPAPFFLDNSVVIRVKADFDFIALNAEGTLAKQFNAIDLQDCREINRIFHCPRGNVIYKDLKTLCLYNLFQQDSEQIENTCEVILDTASNHAIQLTGSIFRLFAHDPVTVTLDCPQLDKHEAIVIEGAYILTLNQTCPRASTPSHLFIRTTQTTTVGQIVHLPTMTIADNWLSELAEDLNAHDVPEMVETIQIDTPGPVSVNRFKQYLRTTSSRQLYSAVNYAQYGVTILVILLLLYIVMRLIFRRVSPLCPSIPRPRLTFSTPPPNPPKYERTHKGQVRVEMRPLQPLQASAPRDDASHEQCRILSAAEVT